MNFAWLNKLLLYSLVTLKVSLYNDINCAWWYFFNSINLSVQDNLHIIVGLLEQIHHYLGMFHNTADNSTDITREGWRWLTHDPFITCVLPAVWTPSMNWFHRLHQNVVVDSTTSYLQANYLHPKIKYPDSLKKILFFKTKLCLWQFFNHLGILVNSENVTRRRVDFWVSFPTRQIKQVWNKTQKSTFFLQIAPFKILLLCVKTLHPFVAVIFMFIRSLMSRRMVSSART